ncbi:MAG: site-specific DNA-methyltransferase [Bacteroidia bacterium]|nr:site-specific DNA-methyltransferase [Bacteroidia bacterium]
MQEGRLSQLELLPLSQTLPSLDFAILLTGTDTLDQWISLLDQIREALRDEGLLFVQGVPENLCEIGSYLDKYLRFKYWIAVESLLRVGAALPSVHAGILLFVKGDRFRVSQVRIPHLSCQACGKPLKDWGGKAHLRHPSGTLLSDVWKDLPPANNYSGLSEAVLHRLIEMLPPNYRRGIIFPRERLHPTEPPPPRLFPSQPPTPLPSASPLQSVVLQGDILECLSQIPSESVDLAFADPPYNLHKPYDSYEDDKGVEEYLRWCKAWLKEYIRVLKPTGSLFLLNLPRWAMHHATFLNRYLHLQNWIVWESLAEPRGKVMPAHYALLFYTKSPSGFTWHYENLKMIDARSYCLRPSCVKSRKFRGEDAKEPLTDIWWDIHRIRHKRDRDHHPCQLPENLLRRIIELTTQPGDVVLDGMAGTGTTAIVAAQLGRRYVAIDIDPEYVSITREKLEQVRTWGVVLREKQSRPRPKYNKKILQLELRRIALSLGRLPHPEDVEKLSHWGLKPFLETFQSWGKAIKAAKISIDSL